MFMTTSKDKTIEVLGQERRRRWSVEEKLAMVRESLEPGQSVSVVARRNGINPNLRISRSSGHPFHEHLTTDSTVIRPPIPRASGH
ncbi:hypothetical protein KNHN1_11460 [Pseudomonas guariconensis]